MPGIDILNDWEKIKKNGLPALIVAVVWAVTELISAFEPKDPSCLAATKFLQNQLDTAYKTIRVIAVDNNNKNKIIEKLTNQNQHTDSLLRAKTETPVKIILNKK